MYNCFQMLLPCICWPSDSSVDDDDDDDCSLEDRCRISGYLRHFIETGINLYICFIRSVWNVLDTVCWILQHWVYVWWPGLDNGVVAGMTSETERLFYHWFLQDFPMGFYKWSKINPVVNVTLQYFDIFFCGNCTHSPTNCEAFVNFWNMF